MIIRICTEDKNQPLVRELCAKQFGCFTMYRGIGAWNGILEPSLTIEIAIVDKPLTISESRERYHAERLAHEIKELNTQESVLIEYIESTNVLI